MAGFFLNLQILYEQLKIRGILCRLSLESDTLCLKGARFYMGASGVSEEYVYVTDADTLTKNPFAKKQGALIVMEEDEKVSELPERCSCIYVSPGQNIHMVFNEIQQIFAYYEGLERRVNEILNSDGSLKDLVALAAEHFQKSIFYHDEFYHILAYSNYSAIAPYVSYNERKSTYVQDAELINQFRTSPSYMETLGTRGGHLWESDYDETRAVYANVWVNDAYKGRLVLQSDGMEYTRGQIYEISFFADAVSVFVKYRKGLLGDNSQVMERLMMEALNDREPDRMTMKAELHTLGWSPFDTYICCAVSLMGSDLSKLSIYSICTDIEEKIEGSYTCYYKNYIYMMVNLTHGILGAAEFRMKMAYIIREGLMHVGVSNVFRDIYNFPEYLQQAVITLQYSEKNASTIWYNEFRTYVLEYWMHEGTRKLTKNSMIPPELEVLRNYDTKNGTQLLVTLKIYLESERNSTLTAHILKIHRSTLPYRLAHINKLTELNLDDCYTRLYLMMGFYALDNM